VLDSMLIISFFLYISLPLDVIYRRGKHPMQIPTRQYQAQGQIMSGMMLKVEKLPLLTQLLL